MDGIEIIVFLLIKRGDLLPFLYISEGSLMENLIVSLKAVLPLFIMMFVGFLLGKLGLIQNEFIFKTNKLVFKFFLPCMFFGNIYNSDLENVFKPKLIIYCVVMLAITFLLSIVFVLLTQKDGKRKGAMVQALFRSNYVILGLPLVTSLFGDESAATSTIVAACIVPFFNIYAVIILEIFRSGKANIKKILLSILKNPAILSLVLALIVKFIGIKLPYIITYTIGSFGAITTPLSLLMLGAFFKFDTIKNDLKDIIVSTVGKLIVVPLIAVFFAVLLGFRDLDLCCILIAFAAPVAIPSFPMTQQMDSDYTLAGEAVIFQSALSCLTLFIWIFLIKQLGFM